MEAPFIDGIFRLVIERDEDRSPSSEICPFEEEAGTADDEYAKYAIDGRGPPGYSCHSNPDLRARLQPNHVIQPPNVLRLQINPSPGFDRRGNE